MNQPVVILVTSDDNDVFLITRAFQTRGLPRPVHIPSGEAAILWLGANTCDVCIVDYKLPGISGIDSLIRIHQRIPNMPVVILSNARSENVAISAFQSGVADYVPKQPGFADAITGIVQQLLRTGASLPSMPTPPLPADIDERLMQPTYQNRLRMVGRELDAYGYHAMNLLEVEGGFVLRVFKSGSRVAEALEFADRDFSHLVMAAMQVRGQGTRQQTGSDLLPTGYEDFLRALGYRLDEHQVQALTIAEFDGFVAVGGVGKVEDREQTTVAPFQWLMRSGDIEFMLDEAFRRRAQTPERAKKQSAVGRMMGRR